MVDTEETTAGTMAVVDLDGDGYVEIISAGYTKGRVYVYTFAPWSSPFTPDCPRPRLWHLYPLNIKVGTFAPW